MFINLLLLTSYLVASGVNTNVSQKRLEMSICDDVVSEVASNNQLLSDSEWTLVQDYQSIKNANADWNDERIITELYKMYSGGRDYSYGGNDLTSDEFWAIVLNLWPHQYITAYNLTVQASNQTEIYYPNQNNFQNDGDAFRHTYWSALLTYEFGADFAILLTSAHESNQEEGIDKEMDMHNNNNGTILLAEWLEKFSSNSTNAWEDIGEFIYHCIANGEIYDCVKIDQNKLVYTNQGYSNITKYSLRSIIDSIQPSNYGFEPQYYFYQKSKSVLTSGGATIYTKRLRTGYIEEEYVVLSPRRSGAGTAYLDFEFSTPINAICINLALWSNLEMLDPNNSYAIVFSSEDGQFYERNIDLLNDINLSTDRANPIEYRLTFPSGTKYVKIAMMSPAVGDRNKGRLCIGNMDILFTNPNY